MIPGGVPKAVSQAKFCGFGNVGRGEAKLGYNGGMANSTNKDSMLPVYLVTGEDELKKETVVKRLHARMESYGDLSFNFDRFDGDSASGEDVVSACNTVPFASEFRLVQVDNVDKLKKADSEALVEYLKNPSSSSVLALVASKLAKNTRLYKAVAAFGKSAVIDCAPMKKNDLPRAVRSMAVTHGIALTEGAAHALVSQVGENTVALDAELRKLALSHRGTDPVNESEVMNLVSRTAEVKPWEFVDAFSARNVSKCMWCKSRMDSVSPHALLAMCITRIRELIIARSLVDRGNPRGIAAALKMPDWRVKNHASWARGFTAQELRDALGSACRTERAMKSGANPDDAFLEWALGVMRRR